MSYDRAAAAGMPHAIEAEQALLGLLFYSPETYEDVDGVVAAEGFYEPAYGAIFGAFVDMVAAGLRPDAIVVADKLRGHEGFGALGGLEHLITLIDQAPPAPQALGLAQLIADTQTRRNVINVAQSMMHDAETSSDGSDALLGRIEALMARAAAGLGIVDAWVSISGLVTRVADILSGKASAQYITTGFPGLDEAIGGLRAGRMIVLAGRPSMGKSAVITCMMRRIAAAGVPCGMFSLEMDEDEVGLRMGCDAAYDAYDPRASPVYFQVQRGKQTRDEAEALMAAMQGLRDMPMWFDCRPGLKPSQIAAGAKRLIRRMKKALAKSGYDGPGVLIVDHMHIVDADEDYRGNRVAEVGSISKALMRLAKETGWAVVALAQMSREVDSRANKDKRPQMSDLRWAGEIEQDANTVTFIYRPEKYLRVPENDKDEAAMIAYEEELERVRNKVFLLTEKNRGGPVGVESCFGISLAHNAMWELA